LAPFIVGIAGGTASGKTTVCHKISEMLEGTNNGRERVVVIGSENFYKDLKPNEQISHYNFDHPDAFDWVLLNQTLDAILQGKSVSIPIYDHENFQYKKDSFLVINQPEVILLEGILVLFDQQLREKLSMKIFVDEDSDVRLARRGLFLSLPFCIFV